MTYVPPSHWTTATIGEIAEVSGGLTKNAAKRDTSRVRAPLVSVAAVQRRTIDESAIGEVGVLDSDGDRASLDQGDLLIVEGNGSLEHIGRVALWNVQVPGARHQNHIIRVRPREMSSEYLLEWLASPRGREAIIEQATSATGLYTLSLSKVERLPVPVPPLNEQRRIVASLAAIFERTRAAKVRLDRLPRLIDKLRRSILAAAFSGELTADWRAAHADVEPATDLLERISVERRARWESALCQRAKNPAKAKYEEPETVVRADLPNLPRGWAWATIDELATSVRNGLSPKPSDDPPGIPILRISSVRPMSVDLGERRFLREDDVPQDAYLTDGDLLFTRYNGSLSLVGVAGVVSGCSGPLVYPDKLIRVRTIVDPRLVMFAAHTTASRSYLESLAKSTSGQTGISGADLRRLAIPVPPPAEARVLVSMLDEALKIIDSLSSCADSVAGRLEHVERTALAKAFSGELVEQDPDDEPARELLRRIRAVPETSAPAKLRRARG